MLFWVAIEFILGCLLLAWGADRFIAGSVGIANIGLGAASDALGVALVAAATGAGAVARYHQRLDALRHQKGGIFASKARHRFRAFGAVRHAGCVTQIDDLFVRKQPLHLPYHGQSADPGIKNSNRLGGRIHGRECCRRPTARHKANAFTTGGKDAKA